MLAVACGVWPLIASQKDRSRMAAGHDEVASSVDSEARTMTAMAMSAYDQWAKVRRALCMQHSTHPPLCTSRIAPLLHRSCMGQSRPLVRASTHTEQRRCAASHFPALKPTVSRPRQGQQLTCNLATAFSCPMPHPVWQDGRLSLIHISEPTRPY